MPRCLHLLGANVTDLSWSCASRYWLSLRAIQCISCQLTSLPPFSSLLSPALVLVSLPFNRMTRITPDATYTSITWNSFTKLQILDLTSNRLYMEMPSLKGLTELYHVDFASNGRELTVVPGRGVACRGVSWRGVSCHVVSRHVVYVCVVCCCCRHPWCDPFRRFRSTRTCRILIVG